MLNRFSRKWHKTCANGAKPSCMKKSILLPLFTVFISASCFGQVSYTTSCEIRNGTGYGSVNNHKDAFDIDGTVWFYFYDSTGTLIGSEDEYEYEYVSARSTEEIEYTTAPTNACKCTFDVSSAAKVQNSFQPSSSPQAATTGPVITPSNLNGVSYTTTCKITNGTAYGYVNNLKTAFEIDGKVWFHFYDSNGRFIDSEDEYEAENISSQSTEEIEHTTAPTNACKCTFDVTAAIKAPQAAAPTPTPAPTPAPVPATALPNTPTYTTSCEIRNGTAYGYVHNLRDNFEIDGYVWFYFYDSAGNFVDSEDEYEYEYVSSRTTEEVETTTAPANACKCAFEVNQAIKK